MNRIATQNVMRAFHQRRAGFLCTTVICLLAMLAVSVRAAIPAAALADKRFGLGYLVVTNYPGVKNDGSTDCTVGLQNAINDAYSANGSGAYGRGLAVFFSPGIYVITNTLQCYEWANSNNINLKGWHIIVGSTEGASRPLIKLMNSAPKYQDSANPRPLIHFTCWGQTTGPAPPVSVPNPMTAPSGYYDDDSSNMGGGLRNIDFNCGSGNPYAIGVVFEGAQWVAMENVKVSATNAMAGFYQLPGAGGYAANIEAAGGQYGIIHGKYSSLGLNLWTGDSGGTAFGVTLEGQTVAAILEMDASSPVTIAGFKITGSQPVQVAHYDWNNSWGILTMIDGQIGINSATNPAAFFNVGSINGGGTYGRDLYLRNVYVTGTTNLVASGPSMTTGSGAWSYIKEYSYNSTYKVSGVPPNSGYADGATLMNSYSMINGTVKDWTTPFPVGPTVTPNSGAPPSDLVTRHLWKTFPSYNGAASDPPTVVVSTNAGWFNTNGLNQTTLLQSNIDYASASSTYQGRVFLPAGKYYITNTITLHTNTTLLGVGWGGRDYAVGLTVIEASSSWKPSGPVTMLTTENSASATTTLADLTVVVRRNITQSDTNYSWFTAITWQAGANSLVRGVNMDAPYSFYTGTWPRQQILLTNNGGGKWYGVVVAIHNDEGPCSNHLFRRVKINGTTQPLWFYAINLEHGSKTIASDEEAEVNNASNIRFLAMKREGNNPVLVLSNCANIAAYGFGNTGGDPSGNGYFQVIGNSTNILFANVTASTGAAGSHNMVYEHITGLPTTNVLWPNFVSLYKRGEINDTNMFVAGGSPPPTPTGLTATRDTTFPSEQINLSWNGVTNELGYSLKWSAANGGPYSTFTSPGAGSVSATDTNRATGTTNYYVISAYNSFGESGNSSQASASLRSNAPPTLNAIANLTTNINATLQTVNLSGIGPGANETNLQILTVTCWSGNTALIPNPNASYTTPNATGSLTFTPVTNAIGTTTVFVKVQDSGGTIGGGVDAITNTFTVTINNTNSGGGGGNTNGYAILQTAKAPAIDGTIDSVWNTANSAAITNVGSGVITNASECSGTFRLLYDTTNLYVLLKVTDDYTDHSTDSTTFIYYNDAIEVYVDANNTKTTNYQANDFHYTLSLVGTNALLLLREGNNHTNGVVVGWRQTGTNADYVAEMKIPWSLLGQTNVSPNALLGFDAQIDHAHQGGTRDGDLFWHGTNDTDFMDPRQFGTAKLENVPADVAIVLAPTAPAIDGTIDALWNSAYASAITNVSTGVITNASECSGTFQLLYDASNLYVLFQIMDDFTDHSTDSTTQIYFNDAVEFYLAANNARTTNYVTGDFHFAVSLVGTNAVLMWNEANNHTNGVVVAWHQTGINANYVAEMKVPWSLVGQTNLAPDSLLGFDAQIDHAHKGGTRDGELQWHDNADQDFHDPSKFGTARFAPAP